MFAWAIDDDGERSPRYSGSGGNKSGGGGSSAAAALLSTAEVEAAKADLMIRTRRPTFLGKLLRTCAILLVCSFIAALLPQIQVAFGLLGSTVSTCTAHAFPGALCLKMAASASGNTDGSWCAARKLNRPAVVFALV